MTLAFWRTVPNININTAEPLGGFLELAFQGIFLCAVVTVKEKTFYVGL